MITRRNLLQAISVSLSMPMLVIGVIAQEPTPSPNAVECPVPVYKGKDLDKNVKIMAKPDPDFTSQERERYDKKQITLRACFCGSGKVTDIIVTSGLTDDMNARATEAARQIQFTPAEKDGKNASRLLIVSYWVRN